MKIKQICIVILLVVGSLANAQKIQPKKVLKDMERVANWQIFHYRNHNEFKKAPLHRLDWTMGALYVGMLKWAELSGDQNYYDWLKNIGDEYHWGFKERLYHADDHTVGQMYIELFRKYKDSAMIKPLIKQFDYILNHRATMPLANDKHHDRWAWCDALFMAPPVWAKLYKETKNEKYLDFLMEEFKTTTDYLFDDENKLYFRDDNFFDKREDDKKIFWGRGNGWVVGGLVNVMNELDKDSEEYNYFLDIYKKMAKRLIEIQTPEGHWSMSLVNAERYPTPETSGSSFFIYGLAWGINEGILDKETYEPSVQKGWNAMVGYVDENGRLGYVQPIGLAPGKAWADRSYPYGVGAFLSAGSEVYKLYKH